MQKQNTISSTKLNVLVKVSILSVISLIIMMIEFSVPIFPSFLQIDLSDLPALFGGFALGPAAGVIIALLKNILHGLLMTSTAWVGELANFSVGVVLVLVSSGIYHKTKSKKGAVIGLVLGSIAMSLVAGILNYFIFLPAFAKVFHSPIQSFIDMAGAIFPMINTYEELVIWSIIPFNLLKGVIVSVVTLILYKKVSPLIHSQGRILKKLKEEKASLK